MATAKPLFATSPSITAARGASVAQEACVDRDNHQTSDYALSVPCPNSTNHVKGVPNTKYPSDCGVNNTLMLETPKREFYGDTIYPQMLMRPDGDIARMQALEWVDEFTERASLVSLTYMEGLEVFTLLSVEFEFDIVGNVESKIRSWSWKDLIDGDKSQFIVREVFLLLFAVYAVYHTATLVQTKVYVIDEDTGVITPTWNPFRLFEFFSRCLLLVTSLVLIIWWAAQQAMEVEFEKSLRAFMSVEGPAPQGPQAQNVMDAFFSTAECLRSHADALNWLCVLVNVVAGVQLVQLAVYFHEAHPRMAYLIGSIQRAFFGLLHLALLLALVFFFFAFVVHWMFGRSLSESETFLQAMLTQMRMLYGEYAFIPGAASLDADAATAYWIYALTFLVATFVLLRFVFLSVIVQALQDMKQSGLDEVISRSFLEDAFGALIRPCLGNFTHNKWPSESEMLEWLQGPDVQDPLITLDQMKEAFVGKDKAGCQVRAVEGYVVFLSGKAPGAVTFADLEPSPIEELQSLGAGQAQPSAKLPQPSKMDVKKVAQCVAEHINAGLAQRELSDVNWLTMTGRVTSTLYKEFSGHGLIPPN